MKAIVAAAAAALVASPAALAAAPALRTDHQAEAYLEHGLKTWAGINLKTADFVSAFCVNGYYSAYEKAHRRPYVAHVNKVGEDLFDSFSCTLSAGDRSFHLYVRPYAGDRWTVWADRP